MAKLTLTDVQSGYQSVDAVNNNNQRIEAALENTLSRDGTTPNQMNADLDMNGHYVMNQPASTGEDNFIYRGDWVTDTAYVENNLVSVTVAEDGTNGGASYICLTDHTSGTFSTDLASAYWRKIASRGASGGGAGDLVAASNLSDVSNVVTALANLGGLADVHTTRGDITVEGAAAPERLAIGASGTFLSSDGTDPVWTTGGWTKIGATQTASASTNINFTSGITSAYRLYIFVLDSVVPVIDGTAEFAVQVYQAAAAKVDANYAYHGNVPSETSTAYAALNSGGARDTAFYLATNVGAQATEGFTGMVYLHNPAGTTDYKRMNWQGTYASGTPVYKSSVGGGAYLGALTAVDGVRFAFTAGSISSGSFTLYGIA